MHAAVIIIAVIAILGSIVARWMFADWVAARIKDRDRRRRGSGA
jgi:hypothetical protein